MDLIAFFQYLFGYIFSIQAIILFTILIFIFHIILFLLRDRKDINRVKELEKIENFPSKDINEIPLINFVIPAWKEGENLKRCLFLISNLKYPNFKVILNAGGSEETIEIANSFKNDARFIILFQKAGEGKIKAINECLNHISEGLIYLIDADILLTDEIIHKMLKMLLSKDENLVVSKYRPYKDIESNDLVKYTLLNRLDVHKDILPKYVPWISANTLMKFNVIKTVKKFSEKRLSDDGLTMGTDITSQGFKIFYINDLKVQTYYPDNLKIYFSQRSRWIENALFNALKNNKTKVLKFFLLTLLSIYIFTCPIWYFFNFYLF
ncbi:MAG: glycosyltransferase, partial [Promethearchaeota archaeon]